MEKELIYWRHYTPVGIKIEEISGAEDKSRKLWIEMARQLYCENGKDDFRIIGHFSNGAPYLYGELSRISISHTDHFMVVASLPKTPEASLGQFCERTALGVDVEKWSRLQVINVRDKFLSMDEAVAIPADDVRSNIIAWTAKEALYKAAMTPGVDFRNDIIIESLPQPSSPVLLPEGQTPGCGKAYIKFPSGEQIQMQLYCYDSENCCVMLAFSPKCAKFKS